MLVTRLIAHPLAGITSCFCAQEFSVQKEYTLFPLGIFAPVSQIHSSNIGKGMDFVAKTGLV